MQETPRLPPRYRPLRLLGEGGAGRVWLVEDTQQGGTTVALKELIQPATRNMDALRLEFATLCGLRHPNLVEVYAFDTIPETGSPCFTLEHIEGDDLGDAVRAGGPETLVALAVEALRALAFLHDFGVIHRDIKPRNLLVRRVPRIGCRLVMLDFGLALSERSTGPYPSTTAGTLRYLAPEMFDGGDPGVKTDLYALGAVLFEAIHGVPPFDVESGHIPEFIERVRGGRRARPALPEGYPPGLHAWIESLLSPDPGARPAAAADALARLSAACDADFAAETPSGRAARLASGPPAGREAEIARLRELLDADAGSSLIWIGGGRGMGKKRLLRWFSGDLVANGWHEVTLDPAMPTIDAEELERLLAELERIAEDKRVCVVIPEVELGGERTLQLLERIVFSDRSDPIHAIVSGRGDGIRHPQLKRLLARAGDVPAIHSVELPPLDIEGVERLVERVTGSRPTRSPRLSWFRQACEGRVDYAGALLIDGVWEKGEQAQITLDLSIGNLFDDLPRVETKVLETLSLVRVPIDPALIATITGIEIDAAREAMTALCGIGVARRVDAAWSIETSSLARVVTDRMAAGHRRALYRRIAETLEDEPGFEPGLLARLWSGAGEPEASIKNSLLAADRMAALGDHSVEAEHCAEALRYLSRKDPRRFALRMRHGAALRHAGRHLPAARAYAAARVLAPDARSRADAWARHAATLVHTKRFERAQTVAGAARAAALEAGDALSAGRARIAEGIAAARMGRGNDSLALLREAVTELEPLGDDAVLLDAVNALATAETNHDPVADASATFARAIELAERTGQTDRIAMSYGGLGFGEFRRGRLQEAAEHFVLARRIAAEHHRRRQEAVALGHGSYYSVALGRYAEALELGKEAMLAGTQIGEDVVYLYGASSTALVLAECGRPTEGARLLERALARSDTTEITHRVHALLAQIEVGLKTPEKDVREIAGWLETAMPEVRRAEEPDTLLWGFVLEMALRVRQGKPTQAKRGELERWRALGGGWEHPYLALLADLFEAGAGPDAAEAARNALRRAEALDLPHLAAKACALLVSRLLPAGERAAVEEVRSKGREALERACERIGDNTLAASFRDRNDLKVLAGGGTNKRDSIDRQLVAVYALIRRLNSESDPDTLLESILDMALEVVRAERGMILLRDKDDGDFSVHLARNLEQETIADAGAFSGGVIAQAGAGKAVLSLDARNDSRFSELKSVSLYGIHALMCVPLRAHDRIVGAVYVDSKEDGLFTPDDLRFLEAFADHASLALANARRRVELVEDTQRLQQEAAERAGRGNLVGNSAPMKRVFELIDKVATSELPVLIHGESGTGKELVAQAIHYNGPRGRRVFISENCAAIPDTLLQSELFGHVRGAFTGADRDRAGLFEQAHGGTLFLDEIGDMSPTMQAQILRALQEGEVRRVGGASPIRVDVRVIAATHRDLQQETAAGRFREDLLYRLQVLLIELPPLRERRGDVRRLTRHFLQRIAAERGKPVQGIGSNMLERLERCRWPGNVRQLQNTLQRLALLAGDGPIGADLLALDASLRTLLEGGDGAGAPAASVSLSSSERDRIAEALQAAGGNRSRAARLLGISRATIYRKIKELEL